jgi:methyltransferase (TIGR00027 family)
MTLHRASKTAITTAINRAAHQVFDDEPRVLDDPISLGLVPEAGESALRANALRFQEPKVRRLRANLVLRSRFTEDQLQKAAKDGATQFVILGAGLDTFAYRQPHWSRALTIVEVDHPASQQFKMSSLKSAGIIVPRNVSFLSIDFDTESVADALRRAPLDPAKRLFVSWLGVSQYLSRDAVVTTLRGLAGWPSGTELVFTYMSDDWSSLDPEGRAAIESAQAKSAADGEPWLSRFSAPEVSDLLAECGFSCIAPLSIHEAKDHYFRNRADKLEPAGGPVVVHTQT